MNQKQLLAIGSFAYHNGKLSDYYDSDGNPNENTGDGLASFIVEEIVEVFSENDDQPDTEIYASCIIALSKAITELEAVRSAYQVAEYLAYLRRDNHE